MNKSTFDTVMTSTFFKGDKVTVNKEGSELDGRSGIVDCEAEHIVHVNIDNEIFFLNKRFVVMQEELCYG